MEKIKIEFPLDFKDLRLKHLEYILEIKETEGFIGIIEKIRYNSIFAGVDRIVFENVTAGDNALFFERINALLNTYKPLKELPGQITLDGKEYVLHRDTIKHPARWVMDADAISEDIAQKLEYMPAFIYIEKGMQYGQMDKNKNYINSVIERAEVMKQHMPLDLFMAVQGFFLNKYNLYAPLYHKIRAARKQILREQNTIGTT